VIIDRDGPIKKLSGDQRRPLQNKFMISTP